MHKDENHAYTLPRRRYSTALPVIKYGVLKMTTNTQISEKAAAAAVEMPKINYKKAADYFALTDYIKALSLKYRFINVSTLGTTVMGREIPVISLGKNKSSPGVLYVGGYHGTDIMTPAVLLRFIGDYAQFLEAGRRMYSVSMPYLYETRTIHIIPMLNPDGYVIRKNGVAGIPNGERLTEMDGGDFTNWRYNARGIDIARGFTFDGELMAAGEPEVAAICRYAGMSSVGVIGEIRLALSLNIESCGIKYKSGKHTVPRTKTIGRLIERMSGCGIDEREMMSGGFASWFLREIGRPAFEFGCLADDGEVVRDADEYVKIYASLREVLFSSPLLI